MNTREKSEIRELTAAELEEATGGTCAKGTHFKTASLSSRGTQDTPSTPVGIIAVLVGM
jgi:hypothetical protein